MGGGQGQGVTVSRRPSLTNVEVCERLDSEGAVYSVGWPWGRAGPGTGHVCGVDCVREQSCAIREQSPLFLLTPHAQCSNFFGINVPEDFKFLLTF